MIKIHPQLPFFWWFQGFWPVFFSLFHSFPMSFPAAVPNSGPLWSHEHHGAAAAGGRSGAGDQQDGRLGFRWANHHPWVKKKGVVNQWLSIGFNWFQLVFRSITCILYCFRAAEFRVLFFFWWDRLYNLMEDFHDYSSSFYTGKHKTRPKLRSLKCFASLSQNSGFRPLLFWLWTQDLPKSICFFPQFSPISYWWPLWWSYSPSRGQKIMDVAKEEHKDVLLKLFGQHRIVVWGLFCDCSDASDGFGWELLWMDLVVLGSYEPWQFIWHSHESWLYAPIMSGM